MARPNVSQNPTIPTQESPVQAGNVCGESWHYSVRVVKGRFSQQLGPLGEFDLVSGASPSAIQDVYDWMDSNAYDRALEQVKGEYEDLKGLIGTRNRIAIEAMIARSDKYYGQAEDLRGYWDRDFNPGNLEEYDGFPLTEIDDPDGRCKYRSDTGLIEAEDARGFPVRFYCLTPADIELHTADRKVLQRLISAALRNLRCAQEAAWATGLYAKNKSSTMGSLAPRITSRQAQVMDIPTQADVEPQIDLEPDYGGDFYEEPEPEPAKKSNTLLLVGAAAVAVLVLSRK